MCIYITVMEDNNYVYGVKVLIAYKDDPCGTIWRFNVTEASVTHK